jgi:Fe-S-cluster containining protein
VSSPSTVTCNFSLELAGRRVDLEAHVPARPVGIGELLPVLEQLTDSVVDASVARERREGRMVSCRAGCGACCRQIVPIAESEARRLAAVVGEMPEERRQTVEARFAEALRRLESAGILERIRALTGETGREQRHALGLEYFRAAAPCPFLEEESCSIHPHRPLACREYLVTSPAEECADPRPERIQMVKLAAKPSSILYRCADAEGRDAARFVPLVLALEWAESHPLATEAKAPGPDLLESFVRELAR